MNITQCHTVKDALLFCIEQEQLSFESYRTQSQATINVIKKSMWDQLANDELRHRTLLTSLLDQTNFISQKYVASIASTPIEFIEIDSTSSSRSIIQNAINSEIEAHNEYLDIAQHAPSEEIRQLFLVLSQEEMNHKRTLEIELEHI
ncbi:MAG: Rubrerythrin [Bacteroidetes bacterium]|jgi:rubrerythrin|nr:Rubrerythrin [Bacteroidota bacterium]